MQKEGKRRKMISVMLPLGCCRGRGREVTGEGHALLRPTPLSNTRYWSGTSLLCFHKGASATPFTRQTASAPVTCNQHHIPRQQFDNKTDKQSLRSLCPPFRRAAWELSRPVPLMLAHREILTPSTKGLHSKRPLTPPNKRQKAALPSALPPPFNIIQYRVSGLSAASVSSSRNYSPRGSARSSMLGCHELGAPPTSPCSSHLCTRTPSGLSFL